MDRDEVNKIKLEVLERRNYLKNVDSNIATIKHQLYGGMRNRIVRREGRRYSKIIGEQKNLCERRLSLANSYLKYLDDREAVTQPNISIDVTTSVPDKLVEPRLPLLGIGSRPEKREIRTFPRGINSRSGGRVS